MAVTSEFLWIHVIILLILHLLHLLQMLLLLCMLDLLCLLSLCIYLLLYIHVVLRRCTLLFCLSQDEGAGILLPRVARAVYVLASGDGA